MTLYLNSCSTRALTDSNGSVIEGINYDSFGNGASTLTRYGYTGREWDADSNLYYYRNRWYDPQSGRFISEDPIGLNGGVNLYAYVGNNPLGFTDPTGNQRADARGFEPGELERAQAMRAEMVRWDVEREKSRPMYQDNFDWWGAFWANFYNERYECRQRLEAKINEILSDPGLHFALIGIGPLTSIAADLGASAEIVAATNNGARVEGLTAAGAQEIGILRDAASGKGNFGLGSSDAVTANRLGRAWVGENFKVASDGKTLISSNGLRQFRPPSFKPNLGRVQANFESRWQSSGPWQANGHLDIIP